MADNVVLLSLQPPDDTKVAGGVSVGDGASLLVDGGSIIRRNKALPANTTDLTDMAGGILGSGNARITITGSTIADNRVNSTGAGAGVLVVGSASLLIAGGSHIEANGPAEANGATGAIVARASSVVNVTDGVQFMANRAQTSELSAVVAMPKA